MSVFRATQACAAMAAVALSSATPAIAVAETHPLSSDQLSGERASYERVAQVLINAMICEPFGYSVDRDGLTQWTHGQVNLLVDQAEGNERRDVHLRMNRAATSRYWFVRNRYVGALNNVNLTGRYNPRQFTLKYRKVCADLASASDVGTYFKKTGEEPQYLTLLARARSALLRDEVAQRFKRAYPPYLGQS